MAEPLKKTIHYIRHGESTSNAAQEAALKRAGLVHSTSDPSAVGGTPEQANEARQIMYQVMNDPEHVDTALSARGRAQARELAAQGAAGGRPRSDDVELIVTSTLSRAVHTAVLVFPREEGYVRPILCLDELREFAGPPTSEQRHRASEMVPHFVESMGLDASDVDVSSVPEEDALWQPAEEPGKSAFARADRALAYLMQRPERVVACVGHTSFLRQCMLGRRNKSVVVHASSEEREELWMPFGNCEVRSVEMWMQEGKYHVRPIRPASSKL